MPFDTQHLTIRHFALDDAEAIYRLSREPGMNRFIAATRESLDR